ncbi:DUF4421 family protein [Fulvivirga sedimenti]|uniref:DUF4421 domain-containing protein n=1 Tax=Fulvivirga sedimenti TaxID=2879465 RepID=A0A9X1KX39_9BACT|nr:DUF4421 family protein [Fulvivirga sedimenti]MCA6074569.1 DUF4421 domain-containing protein [Fulvivirga sedimenti]MCA6075746.1 DUF4421 domain-containing protein [Fulvivirga sedimenti]MCA6076874.1 DUF4421 domain-containing protein [Fulvivirga sedimenti]
MVRIIIISLLLIFPAVLFAQSLDDVANMVKPPDVDSSFVELNQNDWTVRLFSNLKYQSFSLKNRDGRIFFRPRGPFSGGIGGSYKTLLLDLGLRFNNDGSQRFDLQTSLLLKSYFINLSVQKYTGFEETNPDEFETFRGDITTFTINLEAAVFPNHREISFRSLQSGIDRQKKGSGSILYGGFIGYHKMSADSSIIPSYADEIFSEKYDLTSLTVRNIGVIAGYLYIYPVSNNLFIAGSVRPGLGVQWGKITTETDIIPDYGVLYMKMAISAGAGFNWQKFYSTLNYNLEANYIRLGDSHIYNYNSGKVKLAVGYKI